MVNDQCERRKQDCRHNRKYGEKIGGPHMLALGLVETEFGKYVASGKGKVGGHSGQEAEPSERELRDTSHDNSANNRKQGEVNRKGEEALQEDATADNVDEGLQTFNNVRKRYSNSTEGDDSTDMADNMANADRENGLKGLLRYDGLLAQTESPDRKHVDGTHKKLGPGYEPWDWKPVENFLVGNVVHDIEGVPQEDV